MTDDERATAILSVSQDMQRKFVRPIANLSLKEKSAITVKLLGFADIIANYRRCSSGEIIWLRAKPFDIDHVMSVQAAIKIFGEDADKTKDSVGSSAAFILRSMNLLSHAKTIASDDRSKVEVMSEIYSLCRFIDALFAETKNIRS